MLFVLILLNMIFVTSTTVSWHQLDGIEYYIEYTDVTEAVANADCKRMNAILAVVKSQRIQDFLVKNIDTTKLTGQPYSFYIGLSRSGLNTLKWSDGTTTDTSVFTYWDSQDDVYDCNKLCVTMGFHAALNLLFKWKIEQCSNIHRYICQRSPPTTIAPTTTTTTAPATTTAVTTEQITTEVLTSKGITTTEYIRSTTNNSSIVNNAPTSGTSVVGYAMIGVGAIFVLVICGIIYIKCYRNNKPTTGDVNKRNSVSEEGDSPVVVDNVLYGTSAEPIQDLYEKADEVNPVYSCADASASYVVPNVEFHAEEVVYDCSKNDASENGNSIKLPVNDIYAAVVKKNKRT